MPYKIIHGTASDIEDQLNGAYVLGPFTLDGLPVGALTLIFAQPGVATITFAGGAGAVLSLDAIVAAINSGLPGSPAALRPADPTNQGSVGRKFLVLQDASSGISITGGTARSLFRIPTATMTFVPTVSTKIVSFVPDATKGHYVALIAP